MYQVFHSSFCLKFVSHKSLESRYCSEFKVQLKPFLFDMLQATVSCTIDIMCSTVSCTIDIMPATISCTAYYIMYCTAHTLHTISCTIDILCITLLCTTDILCTTVPCTFDTLCTTVLCTIVAGSSAQTASCSRVECPALRPAHCQGIVPPGACCPVCGQFPASCLL